ncbi:6-pyruvoyl-tetrahydropterin synthase [Clostridium tetanomorphum]|uniref:Uncharacterized protein n=1 Tax=Clostridium tetanomorphum TaxID=1553 RepID=A0A923E886_CLOTT|nr:hypothetical protein [Clostridium tetanomorphum]KAJ49188.1 hypothetical protein CTM_24468 [Clostridium tetanomorphum DSM 665]KAJ50505.1 hypothetical protein CTM_17856 [Clostridium tetanomorphum DSM 665]MBC2398295.1 hypothetical protein [Clostridium tetanomorphum]MBP1865587.1 6-pyruvoyl-tetrahydropterin synthase [Clostridium tetanomorphum]NRS85907.1 6-pyruvoyl-tetrahydropterin synthase [Clostridium tetanomorphum]
MSDFEKQIVFELSKQYIFETFDFKNRSPEDLLKYYQETAEKISKVIEDQNAKFAKENIEMFSKLNTKSH